MAGKNRRTLINFPVFNAYTVTVIFAKSLPATIRAIGVKEKGFDDCAGLFIPNPRSQLRSWMILEIGHANERTIAHEASHVVRHMFKVCGVRCDEETYAYHLGHLVDRIHKFNKKAIKNA